MRATGICEGNMSLGVLICEAREIMARHPYSVHLFRDNVLVNASRRGNAEAVRSILGEKDTLPLERKQ
jgi:hypothetical protein